MRFPKSNIPDFNSLSKIPTNELLRGSLFQEHLRKHATGNNSSVHNSSNNYLQNSLPKNDLSARNNNTFDDKVIGINCRGKRAYLKFDEVENIDLPSVEPLEGKGKSVTAVKDSPPKEHIELCVNKIKDSQKDTFKKVDLTKRLEHMGMDADLIERVLTFLIAEGNIFEVIEAPRKSRGRPPGPTYRVLWGESKYFPDPNRHIKHQLTDSDGA